MTDPLRAGWRRLVSLARRRELEVEFEQELASHLELLIEEYEARGLPREEARRLARIKLGGEAQLAESHRDRNGLPWLEQMLRDWQLAFRSLGRNRLLSAVAVMSLALGIGANTAIYSLLDQVLHRRLPVANPEQLVWLNPRGPAFGNPAGSQIMSYPMYRDIRDRNQVFTEVFGRMILPAHIAFPDHSERVSAEMVSGNYFRALGLKPYIGRLIGPEDDRAPGAHAVAVLSYSYWRTRFSGRRSVLGDPIFINGTPFKVIGVSGPEFKGLDMPVSPQIRVPVMMKSSLTPNWDELENRRMRWFNVYARLKPGITREKAQAALEPLYAGLLEMESMEAGWERERMRGFLAGKLALQPGSQAELPDRRSQPLSFLLHGIVAAVLLIACANIANLLLARAASRHKEIAIRRALGVSRRRLIHQQLAESMLLALSGGLVGLGVARWTAGYVIGFAPPEMAGSLTPDLDRHLLLFNFAVATVTGLVFGLAPALQTTRVQLTPALNDQTGSAGVSRGRNRWRKALVAAQMTLSVALLATAAFFVQSLMNRRGTDIGFPRQRLIAFSLDPRLNGYSPEQTRQLCERLQERLGALPGVASASNGKFPVFGGQYWMNAVVADAAPSSAHPAYVNVVGPGYFRTIGVRLVSGREFTGEDRGMFYRAAVVNESFARQKFGEADPVGRRIGLGNGPRTPIEIVGLVKDVSYAWVKGPPEPQVYLSTLQDPSPSPLTMYVRTAAEPETLFRAVERQVREIDTHLPVYGLRTMESQIDERLVVERFMAEFSSGFASLAAALASIGLYGVMSYLVALRARELAIRMALGAARRGILWLVMREAMTLAAAGAAAGLLLAAFISRALASLWFGLAPHDAFTLGSATVLMLLVAGLAGLGPALRATRVDPNRVLHCP
ncbi:MAG: ABC transporter permease [Acidimicrobiia bacterium]|nr:ABC transporter permease [Acidimicrobiia bacterium]